MTSATSPLAIGGVKDKNGQTSPTGQSIKIEGGEGVKEEGKAPASTPAANGVPRQGARPRDVSAARPLAPAYPANVLGIVPTLCPRPDGTSSGQHG